MTKIYLPKANIHAHANGMANDTDVVFLARQYGVGLPITKRIDGEFVTLINERGEREWNGVHQLLHETYDATVSLIRQPSDLGQVIYNYLMREAKEGCIYSEILSSGLNNCRYKGEAASVFRGNMLAIVRAIKDVTAATDARSHAYVSLTAKRHLQTGPAKAHELLDAFEAFRRSNPDEARYITGFNLAGDEERGECSDFKDVFERSSRLGLGNACHAGEVRSVEDIKAALKLPGIRRLGHVLSAIDDKGVMEEIRVRHILVEQLLTINLLQTERYPTADLHPSRAYHEFGLDLALGTDDPGLVGCWIGNEYKLAKRLGFSREERLGFTLNAIKHSFAPREVRGALSDTISRAAREAGIHLKPTAYHSQRVNPMSAES